MKLSEKARNIISAVAPTLGTALLGPFGAIAGKLISDAVGGDVDATVSNATPELLVKLKQAEQEFQARMKELGIEEDKLVYADRADARAREVAIRDGTTKKLAWFILSATVAAIYAMFFGLTKVDSALAGTLIGYLISESKSVTQYYFGSSVGSKEKTELLSK